MKKLVFLSVFLFFVFFSCGNIAFANENIYYVITDKATIISDANSESFNIVCELKYEDEVVVLSEKIKDVNSNLQFYKVQYKEYEGYILSTSISNKTEDFSYNFIPNAKLNKKSVVYKLTNQNFEEFEYNGQKVELNSESEIKVISAYQKNKTYTQISFQIDNKIFSGYVLTENIQVSGFNYYWLIAIFVIIIILSTVIPIIIKNKKKKKKANQLIDKISTSPHKTSK